MSVETIPAEKRKTIVLPPPKLKSRFSLEQALFVRRSIREFTDEPLTIAELSQLLWSCQGITSKEGFRTTPSAGAVFPLEIYPVISRVDDLKPGIYHYVPGLKEHSLQEINLGSFGSKLFALTTKQDFVKTAALNLILGCVTERMEKQYGEAALRYVFMEMGHAAQNVHLQAESLGLGSVAVGYLDETAICKMFGSEPEPLYMVSIGRKAVK